MNIYMNVTTAISESSETQIHFIQTEPTLIEDAAKVVSMPMVNISRYHYD